MSAARSAGRAYYSSNSNSGRRQNSVNSKPIRTVFVDDNGLQDNTIADSTPAASSNSNSFVTRRRHQQRPKVVRRYYVPSFRVSIYISS